jgi:cephalosporin-C deacetylase
MLKKYHIISILLFIGSLLLDNYAAVAQVNTATSGTTAAKKETDAAKKEKEAAKKEKEAANKKEEEETIDLQLDPAHKTAIYDDDDVVNYKVKMKSTFKDACAGNISYEVLTDDNKPVMNSKFPVKIKYHSNDDYSIVIPKQKAGFYKLNIMLALDNEYTDTVRRVFGVSPEKITSTLHRPGDFDEFWQNTIAELKKVAPKYKVTFDSTLSNKDKKVYLVEMHSYQDYVIRGWMVIPTFGHRFPVHYRVPGYGVPMHPNMDADDFIAFDIDVRGNGNSRDNIKLNTDIYSTTGLEDRDSYIYRGAYMDCIRGLDFLYSQYKMGVDTGKIYVEGGSQGGALGVVTAALDKRVKVLTIQVPLYSDIRDTYDISATYKNQVFPFNMFRKYHDTHPGYTWDAFYKVFDYYDPQNFAPLVKCPVLMGIGLLDLYCPPRSSIAMFNHLGTDKKEYVTVANTTHEVNFNYFMFQNNWLREQLRVP